MLEIYWKSGEAKDSADLLPYAWFMAEGKHSGLRHGIEGRDGRTYQAQCTVLVNGRVADLDYGGPDAAFNYDHPNTVFHETDFPVGVMRLIFADISRSLLESVEWRSEGDDDFEGMTDEDVEWSYLPDTFDLTNSAVNDEDGRRKIEQLVVIRQGQPAFRRKLLNAYGRKCAVTGCTIEATLEAAHIRPYWGDITNDVRNGLLLRADIHTLYDLGHIKIDGRYRITALPEIKAAYDLPPMICLPNDPANHPNEDALQFKFDLPARKCSSPA